MTTPIQPTLEKQMQKIAYNLLGKHEPKVLEAIKKELRAGRSVKQIEKVFSQKKYQTSIIASSAILAAHHIKDNPELLENK